MIAVANRSGREGGTKTPALPPSSISELPPTEVATMAQPASRASAKTKAAGSAWEGQDKEIGSKQGGARVGLPSEY